MSILRGSLLSGIAVATISLYATEKVTPRTEFSEAAKQAVSAEDIDGLRAALASGGRIGRPGQ